MCGLLFAQNFDVCYEVFRSALLQMNFRGPDIAGEVANHKNNWLGHNRLSILDLSDNGKQPFYSADKRYVIVFNGEIYNYKSLAYKYGISMRSHCDTELLLELFLILGKDMLSELNGMFAFVILDTFTNNVFAARDRLGIKPLYYYQKNNSLIFSSEIAPILKLTEDRSLDELGVRQYMKLRTFFREHTLYSSIKMFPAGHFWENNQKQSYWHLPEAEQEPPDDEELIELIESSVDMRCLSDVAVGSYLSGGLDSSIIASLSNKPDTWTVGFPDHNEFYWAQIMADKIGSQHHEVLMSPEQFTSLAQQMIDIRQEPLSVPNEVLIYEMTKAVKVKNTVVLCGEGADELFFGYDRIFRWAASQKTFELKEFDSHYAYGKHEDDEILHYVLEPFLHLKSPLQIVAAFFQCSHLHGLLRRLDFATMLCSVEARVPFVDHRLVERLAGVSFDYKMQDGVVKAPLKRCFQNVLHPEVIERKKIGFPVPLNQVFKASDHSGYGSWLDFNLSYFKGDGE